MKIPLCIIILSCWRSGTSWLEDILGKQVKNSAMFGHEQQLFPLLAMMRNCWGKCPVGIRRLANKPICDIQDDFHYQIGLKLHKVLNNTRKYSKQPFEPFARSFINLLLMQYHNFRQVVCKSPENLSPDSFNVAIDVLGNQPNFHLIYLFRRFESYLASCFHKFIEHNNYDIEYYADKYIIWHLNAINRLTNYKPPNLFVLDYNDLVNSPNMVGKFAITYKTDPKIRTGTIDRWKQSKILGVIQRLSCHYDKQLAKILKFINDTKIQP